MAQSCVTGIAAIPTQGIGLDGIFWGESLGSEGRPTESIGKKESRSSQWEGNHRDMKHSIHWMGHKTKIGLGGGAGG